MDQQSFKRYKYASKIFWAGLLDKQNTMGNMDEETTEWINAQLALCKGKGTLISVNTEFVPPYKEAFQEFASRVLVSLCIGINE